MSTVEKKNSEGRAIASPAAFFSASQSLIKSSAAARGSFNALPVCRQAQGRYMRIIKSSRQFTARHFFHEDGVRHRDLEQDRVPARKFKRFNPQSFEKDFVPLSQNALSDPTAAGRTGRFCFVFEL
jgi:hypothetical protein